MGKASVAQEQDVPGNGSREVFQGLFKDLGKQAMALEAILRAVCGRVDKMENWLTEVSFGMTELDLKLRNIAHNIDGTAAVDDEARGAHRWAIPQAETVKPVAPTVSKKLGTDKKVVRVTGMAAAILDQLATTSETTPTETEKAEKPSTNKKSKDKKHNTKKGKANGPTELPPTPLPAVAEIFPSAKRDHYEATPNTPPVPIPAVVVSAPSEILSPSANSKVSGNESVSPELVIDPKDTLVEAAQKHPDEPKSKPETQVMQTEPETGLHVSAASVVVPEQSSKPQPAPSNTPIVVVPELKPSQQLTPNATCVQKAGDKMPILTPSVSSIMPTVRIERSIEPFLLKPSAHIAPTTSTVPDTSLEPTVSVLEHPVAEPQETPTQPSHIPSPSITKLENDANPTTETKEFISISPRIAESEPMLVEVKTPEPKPMTVEMKTPESKPMTVDVKPPESIAPVSTTPVTASPPSTNEHSPAVSKGFKASGAPIRLTTPQREDKAQSQHDTGTSETAIDPLLPHRSPSRRRSSKMVQRPSLTKKQEAGADNESTRRLSVNKRGSHSRRVSISLLANSVEQDAPQPDQPTVPEPSPVEKAVPQVRSQPPPPVEPTAPPVKLHPPAASTAIEQENIEEESQESGSDSSPDESNSSSDEEQDEDEEAAVEEISNAMTALKKLKRAQMLSPEEETELKERAHKKWFQLKGHIKEKQKKDVTNILLKRKKNVFTVSSRIELLEEKSREIFAALKHITNEMREKNDRSTHETLRRRVADIEQSLLTIDSRIASLSAPAMENVRDLENEVVSLRTTVQMQLTTAQSEATARHSLLEEALASQRALVETLAQDVPAQIDVQTELFMEKLKQLPDHTVAIENLRRSLKRKADLKLLKELEARLLGLDAENEDCLVRCLSCRKEVINPHSEKDTEADEQDVGNGQLRKVNPGPSSARIYRSNIPFNAQTFVQDSILEESSDEALFSPQAQPSLFAMPDPRPYQQFQSAGDSHASEKPAIPRSAPTLKRDPKTPQASPLTLMNITATRAILSPDRPISAPVVHLKKKSTTAARSKSVLKSLTPQPGLLPQ
ncbi:hypothetical protein PI124_g5853 [Phytophthora idaei]|nr:hypothetical protein PI125_g324 [Phytophthora idaei]KAG3249481.1 hypothetical protein PI124_g5853 [Phytophthora idaei]